MSCTRTKNQKKKIESHQKKTFKKEKKWLKGETHMEGEGRARGHDVKTGFLVSHEGLSEK